MGSSVRLSAAVTTLRTMFTAVLLAASLCVLSSGAPQGVLPPGIDPVACPNYPFCGPSPTSTYMAPSHAGSQAASQALLAHQAAERAVIAQQQFTGLVGPSGNIGPSGLCGPSGCIQF